MDNLKIEYVDIDSVKPYKNNAKLHPEEQVEQIKRSIKDYKMCDPIGVWHNEIVEGHGRLLACKELGFDKIPIIRLDHLTDEQRKEYILVHNKTTMNSDFDKDILSEELNSLFDFDSDFYDFGLDDLGTEFDEGEITEDETPEDVETRCKLGDMWQLGNHKLICGDSTDVAVIDRLMDGVKADMVFTDPPYGVAYQGGIKIENGKIESNGKKQIKNDALDYEKFYQFLYDVFTNIKVHTKEKSAVYVFYTHSRSREFLNAFHDASLKQRSIIIWHKTSGGFGDFMAQYMNAYEPCIYGSNGESVNWYGATNEKTVWDMDKEKKCDLHPTMKPIELVGRAVKNSSKKDDVVLDCFGGSGSTLIACEQLNRKCYMCELDEHYCDVILQRYINFKGSDVDVFLLKDGEKIPYSEVNS